MIQWIEIGAGMADADLEEYKRLEGVIASLEKLQAGSPQGASPLLSAFIDDAKKQLENLGHKIKEKEKATELEKQTAIQAAVDRETALNAIEKEAYRGFLKEDFFTKADFGRLESFYDKSYDKLTDGGQEQMHHRVWEGIRHKEFTFDELPENVQKKDSARIYHKITDKQQSDKGIQSIPEQDRSDFVKAYETHNQHEVSQVLKRESFSRNVSVKDNPAPQENKAVQQDRISSAAPKKEVATSEISLSGLTEFSDGETVSPPPIAVNGSSPVKGRT